MKQSGQQWTKLPMRVGLAAACLVSTAALPTAAFAEASDTSLQIFTVPVPKDYRRPAAGVLPLRVGIARSLDPRSGAEPIFVIEALAESSVDAAARGLIDSLQALREKHDLVFVDQRGTSLSPLLCPPVDTRAPLSEQAGPIFGVRYLASCRSSFEQHELGDLNSRTFAEDLESVRRKLGYKHIQLIGYFYGTRIAEQYFARWPSRVSAAVLADVSPLDYPAAKAEAGALSAAVASTLRACRADAACAARYPRLDTEWSRAAALLSGNPAATAGIDGSGILYWMKLRTLRWTSAASWPRDVDAIANGNLSSVLRDYVAYRRTVLASYPLSLRVTVDCAENMSPGEVTGAAAAEQKVCANWPAHRLAPNFLRMPRTRVPVLAVTADFDIEAPATAVRRAVAAFSNAQVVVFPDRARATDVDWSECIGPLVTTFLQAKGRARLDSSCVNRLKRPPFLIAHAD